MKSSYKKMISAVVSAQLIFQLLFVPFVYAADTSDGLQDDVGVNSTVSSHGQERHTDDTVDKIKYYAESDGIDVEVVTSAEAFSEEVSLRVDELIWQADADTHTDAEGEAAQTGILGDVHRTALEELGGTPQTSLSLDIRFVNADGEEVEPEGGAEVRLVMDADRMREESVTPASLEIIHFKENKQDERMREAPAIEPQVVAAANEGEDSDIKAVKSSQIVNLSEVLKSAAQENSEEAEAADSGLSEEAEALIADFSVDSFSVYTIVWRGYYEDNGRKYDLRRPLPMNFVFVEKTLDGYKDIPGKTQMGSLYTYPRDKKYDVRTREGLEKLVPIPDGYLFQSIQYYNDKAQRYENVQWIQTQYATIGDNKIIVGTDNNPGGYTFYSSDTPNFLVSCASLRLPPEIETISTRNKVKINLYDYHTESWGSINNGHTLQFTYGGNRPNPINSYTGPKRNAGILENTLDENGYPRLAQNGESLAYLFNGNGPNIEHGITNTYLNLDHLFVRDPSGYVGYDSAKNFATLGKDKEWRQIVDLNDAKDFRLFDRASSDGRKFLPFNMINEGGLMNGRMNLWFGMTTETTIVQPPKGKIGDKDMVFNFTGDDDLWVFVDDILILDLGGIHDSLNGYINFATGEVYAAGEYTTIRNQVEMVKGTNAEGLKPGANTYEDYSNHVIKIFYLERGENSSNLKVNFNLNAVPQKNFYLGKTISGNTLPTDPKVPYDFLVQFKKRRADNTYEADYSSYVGPYTVYEGDIAFPERAKKVSEGTTDNGRIKIKEGQFIRIDETQVADAGDKYRVVEYVDDPNRTYSELYDVFSNVSTVQETRLGEKSDDFRVGYKVEDMTVGDAPVVRFHNKVNVENLGTLVVEKRVAGGTAPTDQRFLFDVTIDEEKYTGDYYVFGANETDFDLTKARRTAKAANGKISIGDGEKAVIPKVLWKSPYTVSEDVSGLPKDMYKTEYYMTVTDTADSASGKEKAIKDTELSNGAVTGTMPLSKKSAVSVKVVNRKDQIEVPETGLHEEGKSFLLMLGAGAALALFIYLSRRYHR